MLFSTVILLLPTLTTASSWMFNGNTAAASTMSANTAGSSFPPAPWQQTGVSNTAFGTTGVANGFGGVSLAAGQQQGSMIPAMGTNNFPARANTIPQQQVAPAVRTAPVTIPGGSIFGATVQGTAGVATARIEGASGKDFVEGAFGSPRIFGSIFGSSSSSSSSSDCSGKGKGKGGSFGSCGGKGGKGGKGGERGEGGERGRMNSISYEVLESGSRGVSATFSVLLALGLASTLFFFLF